MDYDIWHAGLAHRFKVNRNRKLYKDEYLIRDWLSTFTYNLCGLSKSKYKVTKPVESKSTEGFELIHTDVCNPCPNKSCNYSKYCLTGSDDFLRF
jgi:hypothetical protein